MTGKQPIVIGKGQEFCLDGSEDIIIGTAGKIRTADGFKKNRIPDKHNAVANDAHTAARMPGVAAMDKGRPASVTVMRLQNRRPAVKSLIPV